MEVELPHEPRIEGLPFAAGCVQLDLEVSEERGYQLVDFQETKAGAVSKRYSLDGSSDSMKTYLMFLPMQVRAPAPNWNIVAFISFS